MDTRHKAAGQDIKPLMRGALESRPEPPRQRRAAVTVDVGLDLQPRTTPANTTTVNGNNQAADGEEAVVILPQEPASFWSTMGGCCVVFFGLFWAVGQFIIGPSIWLGLMFSSPNFGPVMSILAVLLWWGGYWWYIHHVYYPGRPWVPVLDSGGQPQLREMDGQQWVYAQKECGLWRIWKQSWVPREAFPVAEEEQERRGTREERRRQEAEYFRRLQRQEAIAELSPQDFERFVGSWFAAQGYSIEQTPLTADRGVDVRISRDNERAIVQCKHSPGGRVGRPVLQGLFGQMVAERADRAYVVTSGEFTSGAIEWARGKPISLIDGRELSETAGQVADQPFANSSPHNV